MVGEAALFNGLDFRDTLRGELPDSNVVVGRITQVMAEANAAERTAGADWYQNAHNFCKTLIGPHLESTLAAAGLVAVLSPNDTWENNMTNARALSAGEDRSIAPRELGMARRILSGECPKQVIFDPSRRNPKVRAFFDNIARPNESVAVTIDRHARSVMLGNPNDTKLKPHFNGVDYERAARCFSVVAAATDMLRHQVQAITWLTWRRLMGYSNAAPNAGQTSLL